MGLGLQSAGDLVPAPFCLFSFVWLGGGFGRDVLGISSKVEVGCGLSVEGGSGRGGFAGADVGGAGEEGNGFVHGVEWAHAVGSEPVVACHRVRVEFAEPAFASA